MNLMDHPDVHHFLRHMEENPGDAGPALMFADWMEENGFPAHAEMIRLHHSDSGTNPYNEEPGPPGGEHYIGGQEHTAYRLGTHLGKKVSVHLPTGSPDHTKIAFRAIVGGNAGNLFGALQEEGANENDRKRAAAWREEHPE